MALISIDSDSDSEAKKNNIRRMTYDFRETRRVIRVEKRFRAMHEPFSRAKEVPIVRTTLWYPNLPSGYKLGMFLHSIGRMEEFPTVPFIHIWLEPPCQSCVFESFAPELAPE